MSSAHDRAIAGVIDHLSAEAAYVRRGKDGKDLVSATGSSPPASGTARAATATPSSTPTSSSRTSSTVWTGGGQHPTPASCICGRRRPPPCTSLRSGPRWPPSGCRGRSGERPGGVVRHPENRPALLQAAGRIEAALEKTGFSPNERPRSPPSPPGGTSPVTSSPATCFASGGDSSPRSLSPTRPGA